ncbi:hypothetical protein DW1_1146 [Proteiniborus sp. DW1]|uniref:hypothetical protein n=1 Tax=Proteiniborus sp. DW1 TaxID=1889883 RepID=UPI00092DFFF5|nr:hypothetical protein [Proteiniborus sp. DW1]SCG82719.1 hypothetical protein DW1_1146 [Proteiniborus sp. DW1]
MPADKFVGRLYTSDPITGEKREIKGIQEFTINTDEIADYEPIEVPKEINISLNNVEISQEAIEMLIGKHRVLKGSLKGITEQIINQILPNEISWIDLKQNRVHKKGRINKKWRKRHGYTCTVYYE